MKKRHEKTMARMMALVLGLSAAAPAVAAHASAETVPAQAAGAVAEQEAATGASRAP